MADEPTLGPLDDKIEGAGLGKKMGSPRNDDQFLRPRKLGIGEFIEPQHFPIRTADDQQRGCSHPGQGLPSEIWPTAARNDRADSSIARRGDEGRCRTRARPEQPKRQACRRRHRAAPIDGGDQAFRPQGNVEHIPAVVLFPLRQEVEQQGGQPGSSERVRDEIVARAVATRAAAMREYDKATRSRRQPQQPCKPQWIDADFSGKKVA